jgi:hypothetical protein
MPYRQVTIETGLQTVDTQHRQIGFEGVPVAGGRNGA